ncbi:helix-turn-helix transcriptional regulator [Pseudomonas sp. R5(2019)]|uniref:helix-turn-helix domain-containing protein n=1 Tax=Pseudomonas sp. R5(2019) TaxID=2697566 RepID=UPI0014121C7F|nr:helix-turn-helix transcriptional regulator [Pseudomonas sp. R5(2019)]NBA98266.1 helix-turn-helix transcriptional regulator [Pseudomonas sp. R5(2019)]
MHGASLLSLQRWSQAIASALMQRRGADFAAALVDAIDTLVPVESVMISLERKGLAPTLLYDRGIPAEYRQTVIRRYFSRGYLLDPFCLAVDQGLAEGFYSLADIAPDDFFNSEYYKAYYLGAGSEEDCYFILDVGAQAKISISLFNGISTTRFHECQLATLRAIDPLLRQVAHQHWDQQLPTAASEELDRLNPGLPAAFQSFGAHVLTEREQEVCHLLLRGHSAKSSAQVLEISPETVRMHRKNLYTKLQIGSQAELFAQFIDWLTQTTVEPS